VGTAARGQWERKVIGQGPTKYRQREGKSGTATKCRNHVNGDRCATSVATLPKGMRTFMKGQKNAEVFEPGGEETRTKVAFRKGKLGGGEGEDETGKQGLSIWGKKSGKRSCIDGKKRSALNHFVRDWKMSLQAGVAQQHTAGHNQKLREGNGDHSREYASV